APIYPLVEILDASPWDARWERRFKVNSPFGRAEEVKQRLGLLTPHYARVDALQYNWSAYYLTSELGGDAVQGLLYKHPDLKNKTDPARRFRVQNFLAQAGWYDLAEEELKAIITEFPQEKEKAEAAKENLHKLRALAIYEEMERAHKAGRHRWVQARA